MTELRTQVDERISERDVRSVKIHGLNVIIVIHVWVYPFNQSSGFLYSERVRREIPNLCWRLIEVQEGSDADHPLLPRRTMNVR